jgi:hypothetical protein
MRTDEAETPFGCNMYNVPQGIGAPGYAVFFQEIILSRSANESLLSPLCVDNFYQGLCLCY